MTYYDCVYRNTEKGPCIQSWGSKYPSDHEIINHLFQMHGISDLLIMKSDDLIKYIKVVGEEMNIKSKFVCELVDTMNRFGTVKVFSCLELPIVFIHKPIGEWLCKACARNLLKGTEDF